MEEIIQLLIIVLMFDAAIVAVGLLRKKNMWHFICAYWVILTIKNTLEAIEKL
jgi:hypothetical protein